MDTCACSKLFTTKIVLPIIAMVPLLNFELSSLEEVIPAHLFHHFLIESVPLSKSDPSPGKESIGQKRGGVRKIHNETMHSQNLLLVLINFH